MLTETEDTKAPIQPLAAILATLPSHDAGEPLSDEALAKYLKDHYIDNPAEKRRRLLHRRRQELYTDAGIEHIHRLIDEVYTKDTIRARLKAWAEVARFDNPIKRVTNDLSTVYRRKAKRTVSDPESNKRYRRLQQLCRQHERSRQINRLLNVHRSLFVGFRFREADRRPVIDIVTPDQCFAVGHPNDPTLLVALIIEVKFRTARLQSTAPKYLVWSAYESFYLTGQGSIVRREPNKFGRIPYVYATLEPPIDGMWPGDVGEDLVGATISAWFANTNLLKETKSATKFPVVQGDMTTAARDQAADSDEVVEVPEGSLISSVDNSMDLGLFRSTSDHVVEHVANNYGMSSGVVKHQGVQSAEARELMRAPMHEIQEEQQTPLEEFEREFAELQVAVLRVDEPSLAFDLDGWAILFRQSKTPLDPKTRLEVFEHSRRLGLTNTLEYLMEEEGLDEEQAWAKLLWNIMVELIRNEAMRPLQAISGSPAAPADGPKEEPNTDDGAGDDASTEDTDEDTDEDAS